MWKAYREKYGSLFVGRRIEQSVGNLLTHYFNSKLPDGKRIDDARVFMLHEQIEKKEISLEDYMMKNFGGG